MVTANERPVAEWLFDRTAKINSQWSWLHAQIPEDIMASGEVRIGLKIRSPASPKELGLSMDTRKLGLRLRQFSLMGEAPKPGSGSFERMSGLGRLRGWLEHKLR